eukprot:tig00001278_g7985.t1
MADEGVNVKSEGGVKAPQIALKVKSQDGNEVHFKIKKSSTLQKLMDAYCQRISQAMGSIRFMFDGQRIQPHQTPEEIGMEDGDEIDAMMEQVGGANCIR